jgi:hypothetical protein
MHNAIHDPELPMPGLPPSAAEDFCLSGGSDPNTESLLDLRHRIASQPDVLRVMDLKLHPREPGQFLYLIQTPFQFPKYVIGQTDALNLFPHVLLTCGMEWSACDYWTNSVDLL